jgi:flagellar hook-associated protein 3 FlgL
MYAQGTANIISGQSDAYRTQEQLGTGRKILAPRDNPVDSALALMTEQAKGVNQTFMDNQSEATSRLSFMETQLGSISDLLTSAIERAAQGSNPDYTALQKQPISDELKRHFGTLLNIANSTDGTGEYIFSGNSTATKPFVDNASAPPPTTIPPTLPNDRSLINPIIKYVGDDGRHLVQVESTQTVSTSESGQGVFMRVTNPDGSLNGRSVFDALKNMINNLDGVAGAPSAAQNVDDLKNSLGHILKVRGNLGAQLNQVESLTTAGNDLSLQFDTRLSKLQGLDYAEAISRFNQQTVQLQASQQSFAKVSQLSLFNLIS